MRRWGLGAVTSSLVVSFAVAVAGARADELVAPPRAKARAAASALPDELEGWHLGEPVADVRARLEANGWRLRERTRTRGGEPILRISAGRGPSPHLRSLQLHFARGRLVGLLARYRSEDASRTAAFEKACAELERLVATGDRRGCVDPARTRILEYSQNGRRVELIDLEAGLKLGVITREKLVRRLRGTGGPSTPAARVPTPAPRGKRPNDQAAEGP